MLPMFLYQSSIICSILRFISRVQNLYCTLAENACIWAAEITTSSKFKKKVWPLKVLKCSVHIVRGPWLTYPRQGASVTKHLNEVCNEPKSMAKTKCHHNENRSPGKSQCSKSLYIVWCQNISLHCTALVRCNFWKVYIFWKKKGTNSKHIFLKKYSPI